MLVVGQRVVVQGLNSQIQYNGNVAIVIGTLDDGKIQVRVRGGPNEGLDLKLLPSKVEAVNFVVGDRVRVVGLKNQTIHNGKVGYVREICSDKKLKIFIDCIEDRIGLELKLSEMNLQLTEYIVGDKVRMKIASDRKSFHEPDFLVVEVMEGCRLRVRAIGQVHDESVISIENIEMSTRPESTINHIKLLLDIGKNHCLTANYATSLQFYERALMLSRSESFRSPESDSYTGLGNCYYSLGKYDDAIKMHERSLELKKCAGDSYGEAISCTNLGIVFFSTCLYERAIEHFERALRLQEQVHDLNGQGKTYGNLGNVYFSTCQLERALDCYGKSRDIKIRTADEYGLGKSYGNLGNVYSRQGNDKLAVEMHEKALEIQQRFGDRSGEAKTLANLAQILFSIGKIHEGLQKLEKAQDIHRLIHDIAAQGAGYSMLGGVYASIGKYHHAIHAREQALNIAIAIGSPIQECVAYSGLSFIYLCLGQYQDAIEFQQKALDISQRISSKTEESALHGILGCIYASLEQYDLAIEMHQMSLDVAISISDLSLQGNSYNNLGMAHRSLKNYTLATQMHEKALALYTELNESSGICASLHNLGNLQAVAGNYADSSALYEKALQISLSTRDIPGQFTATYSLGFNLMKTDQSCHAICHLENALLLCESVQAQLFERNTSRVSLFEIQRNCYICLIQVLLSEGRERDALCVAERAKARTLNHMLTRSPTSQIQGLDPALCESTGQPGADSAADTVPDDPSSAAPICWKEIQQMAVNEGAAVAEYSLLRDGILNVWLVTPDGDLIACRQIPVAEHVCDIVSGVESMCNLGVLLELTNCAMGVRSRSVLARDAARQATDGRGMTSHEQRMLTWVQSALTTGPDSECTRGLFPEVYSNPALILEAKTMLFQQRNVLKWLTTLQLAAAGHSAASGIQAASEAIGARILGWDGLASLTDDTLETALGVGDALAREYVLRAISELLDENRLLRLLHTLLIHPIALELEPWINVLVVPDKELYMVPWPALIAQDGTYLVERHAVRLAPSLSVARAAGQARTPAAAGRAHELQSLVVGNPWPVMDGFDSLPEAELEAQSVANVLPGRPTVLVGSRATKTEVAQRLAGADWAHLACHGWLEGQAMVLCEGPPAEASPGIQTPAGGRAGLLSVHDVERSVRMAGGSTVVLSACNTALGEVAGEGVLGIARAFLAAGAGAVVMSLWSVPDAGTRRLMDATYAALGRGYSVQRALRIAMMLVRRHGGPHVTPRAWAGFVVAGAETWLPRACAGAAVAVWEVADVCSCFERCGLDTDPVRENQMDGKTLLMLTDSDLTGELGLTQDQVARLRAEMQGSLTTAGHRPSVLGAGDSGRHGDELEAALETCLADLRW